MNKALLKKMVGEVSVSTLGALLCEYAQPIVETDEVDEDSIAAIETVVAELKVRAKPERETRQRRRKRGTETQEPEVIVAPEHVTVIGNGGGNIVEPIRKEGDMFQRR